MAELEGVPAGVLIAGGVLVLVQLSLQVAAVVDIVRRPPEELRTGKRWVWLLVAVGGELIGAILYFALGRVPAPMTEDQRMPVSDNREIVDKLYGSKGD